MNITRNNYEEYFLLYADGELNAADKLAVDRFITLHPDLADELEMLMETILDTNAINMPGKHLLFKPEEWTEETLTPQQQDLLLLLDKELPAEKASELYAAIDKDPILQKDWSVLQQAQLPAAIIEMPGKENLYRQERDRRPIPIAWVKWMAAAAVVAGLGWYSISLWNSRQVNDAPRVATITEPVKKDQLIKNDAVPVAEPASSNNNKQTTAATETKSLQNNNPVAAVAKTPEVHKITGSEKPVMKRAVDQTPANTIAATKQTPIEVQQPVITITNTIPGNNIAPNNTNGIVASKLADEPVNTAGSVAKQAVYKEDAFDEPEYVNIAGARIKKQKLRGIFRNVTRTVGRTFDKSNVAQADVASLNK